MILSEEFLNKARSAFDLNEYEIKTWTALLSRGESTAGELAEISSVPRSRVYDILESLSRKGYVAKKNTTPIRYKTVSPEEALKAAKKNARTNAETNANALEKIKSGNAFRDLEKFYKQGSEQINSEVVGLINGRKNLHALLKTMVADAKKTITIASTAGGIARKSEALQSELKKAKDKGVAVRFIAPHDSLPEELKRVAELRKHKSAARFVVVDDKTVLFMMDDDKNVHEAYDTGIVVNSSFFAKGFEHLLNNHWNGMEGGK